MAEDDPEIIVNVADFMQFDADLYERAQSNADMPDNRAVNEIIAIIGGKSNIEAINILVGIAGYLVSNSDTDKDVLENATYCFKGILACAMNNREYRKQAAKAH